MLTPRESKRRIGLARRCLTLISRIAARGAGSDDPDHIGFAIEELSQVLFERAGCKDRVFEPIPADQIRDLDQLFDKLDLVDTFDPNAGCANWVKSAPRSTWN